MATNFPTTLDTSTTLPAESASTPLSVNHVIAHQNIQDALEAVEAKIGVDSSAVTTSHDYKLGEVTSSDKAVGKSATQTLTNKTLTAPVITSPKITVGSDAVGDLHYTSNSDGTQSRRGIGSSGDVLTVTGGVPVWAAPTAVADATWTTKGIKVLNANSDYYAADSGSSTAYVLTYSPAVNAYAAGQSFRFKATNTNTSTTPTLNINSLGAKTLVNTDGTAIAIGQIASGGVVEVTYDGTNMQVTSKNGGVTPAYFEIASPKLSLSPNNQVSYIGFDASQLNPNYLYFGYADQSTSIFIYRFDRQSSGNYIYKGVNLTISTTTNNAILGMTEMGGKFYIRYTDNSTRLCKQYATDLTGAATITGFGTTTVASGMTTDPDGVTIWTFDTSSTNLKSYTVSGTTATSTSTVTLSVGISSGDGRIFRDVSGNFYSIDGVDGTTIQKWNSSGTSQTSITTRLFNYIGNFEVGLGFFRYGSSVACVYLQKLDAQNSWTFKVKAFDLS
jgi:hypothetical protein